MILQQTPRANPTSFKQLNPLSPLLPPPIPLATFFFVGSTVQIVNRQNGLSVIYDHYNVRSRMTELFLSHTQRNVRWCTYSTYVALQALAMVKRVFGLMVLMMFQMEFDKIYIVIILRSPKQSIVPFYTVAVAHSMLIYVFTDKTQQIFTLKLCPVANVVVGYLFGFCQRDSEANEWRATRINTKTSSRYKP